MYIHNTTKEQKTYYILKSENSQVSIPKDTTEIIMGDWYYIHPVAAPTYDVYIQRAEEIEPVYTTVYTQTWSVINLSQAEIDVVDTDNRNAYEANMEDVMREEQRSTLGDPSGFRYSQAMQRYSATDGSANQEDIDFRSGSDTSLVYQENNAVKFQIAVTDIGLLTGSAIVDYPLPDFTMSGAQTTSAQVYLDYLQVGYM